MRILLIHNRYQHTGGEDLVFQMERKLLKQHGHVVKKLVFENSEIKGLGSRIAAGIGLLYNKESARLLERKIQKVKPDIIHLHNFFPLASPSVLFVAKRFNIPVVATLHNFRLICPSGVFMYNGKIYEQSLYSTFPVGAIVRGVYRNSILDTAAVAMMMSFHNLIGTWKTKVDRFIVLTRFAKNKFHESKVNIDDSQFVVKPNFAEDDGASNYERESFYLYVGRLSEEKGIRVVLEAAASHGFRLFVAGDGPQLTIAQAYGQKYNNIMLLGQQPKEKVIELMKRCKALLIPSVCYEGFPLAVVEAFSVGTPVIASRLGSLAEIIENNVTGFHFIPGNTDDLFRKISAIESDPENYELLCQNARQTYLWHYTPEKNYQMLINIYHDVLDNHPVNTSALLNPA